MLRASAQVTSTEVDIQAVNGDVDSAAVGIEFGPELMRFAESVALRSSDLPERRRELLETAGPAVLVDAAGVAANFQRMVRIADAAGIPLDSMSEEISRDLREELGIERFPTARHSLPPDNEHPTA